MRSDQLTDVQLEALSARVRPALRYVRQLAGELDHELDAHDSLRLATWTAANSLQNLLGGLHSLSVKPGSAGKPRK